MMEEGLFQESGSIKRSLRRGFVEARLHVDGPKGPELDRILALQKKLIGSKAVPAFVILDADTEKVLAKATGIQDETQFLKLLNEGWKKPSN